MQCFRCDHEAVQECPRCGALYCDAHGGALCARCMDPMLAVPSYRVFRGSLLALLVGSVVAVWLLVLPPAGADQDRPPASLAGIVQTGTPPPRASPTATASAVAATATATAKRPAATPVTYTVRPGDTVIGIAEQYGVEPAAITQANNIGDPSSIQVGQVLTIPR